MRLAPWWEAPEDDASEKDPGTSSRVQKGYGKKPVMMQVPAYMTRTPPTPGKLPLLLYNACAIMYVCSVPFGLPDVSCLYTGLRMHMLHVTSRPLL